MPRPQYSIVENVLTEPVSYTDAAAHLRVDSTDDTDYINALVSVAREYVDSLTGRVSATMTWKVIAENWSDLFEDRTEISWIDPRYGLTGIQTSDYVIPLHKSPLSSVSSVKYYAPDEASLTTLSTSLYRVITAAEPGLIQLTQSPPAVDDRADAIEIRFVTANAPTEVQKHAIKLMVAHLYEQRAPIAFSSFQELPFSLRALITNQKTGGWF